MRALLFVADQDTPGKKDVTHAFLPEARAFARHYGLEPDDVIRRFPTNAPPEQRRATCTLAIRQVGAPLDVLAFFCHGHPTGIQAGYQNQHALALARLLGQYARTEAHVLLYACNAGRDADKDERDDLEPGPGGDGGFADILRDACDALGRRITVAAHASVGHAAWNPYCRRFAPEDGGRGGEWYIEPGSDLWLPWVRAMRDPRSSLRYRFWSMTREEIAAELAPRVA